MNEQDLIIESDLLISNGDILLQNANNQTIRHILISNGNFLITPSLGVGIYRYQNASLSDGRVIVSRIKRELKKDGFDNIKITGNYNDSTGQTELEVTADRKTAPKRQIV